MLQIEAIGLVVSDKKIINGFPRKPNVKHVNPRLGHCWPKWHNLNKPGRSQLGDATYLIVRLYALWLLTRRFFHMTLYKPLSNM